MIELANTTTWENRELVLFQPVLKAYPTCHSWIITAHVYLGNLGKQWKMFIKQMDRTQQLLKSLLQRSLAPTHLLSTLEAELTNLENIHMSYKPLILAAIWLLKEGTFIWWSLSLYQTYMEKPSTLFGWCTQLAYGNGYDQGHQQY